MRSRVITGVLLILILSACSSQPLKTGDHDLVLRIAQLEPYGLHLPPGHQTYERFKRKQWLDGTVMIEYEFEAPAELALPFLASNAEFHSSSTNACKQLSASRIGLALAGVELDERSDFFQHGEKSRFIILMDKGEPMGNYFGMCKGKQLFEVILGGFYFDDAKLWEELLTPILNTSDKK
ncbi:MAG: hypothetical protein OEZ58_24400 [Gammaproteobacteria bacterium]|nr:hypothetical protein [Gammaproteobacteria bacterium]MDH5732138.1 hypothetical protein [Gammaproteobacteria bacterium]